MGQITTTVSFQENITGDKELQALDVIYQVLKYYGLSNREKVRLLEYLWNRALDEQINTGNAVG